MTDDLWVDDEGERRRATAMDLLELRHFGDGGEHGTLHLVTGRVRDDGLTDAEAAAEEATWD